MNLYLKNISLLSCFILVIAMGECKKDNPQTQTQNNVFHEFRDSLVGTYNCIEHFYSWWAPTYTHDSIIGPTIVTVIKASDDSSVIINSNVYSYSNYAVPYGSDNSQTVFYTYNFAGFPQYAYFIKRNDSIWFQTNLIRSNGGGYYYYYTGCKQ